MRQDKPFPAQIHPTQMERLSDLERLHRLAALATELYGEGATEGLCRDMRVSERQVRRWRTMSTPVPKPVLVALGALVLEQRSTRRMWSGVAEWWNR